MHAFLSNLANRQTDKQTRANAFTSSFVGGNNRTTGEIRYYGVAIDPTDGWKDGRAKIGLPLRK